jgi:hypothetical protein
MAGIGGAADIDGHAASADLDANDPKLSSLRRSLDWRNLYIKTAFGNSAAK